MLVVDFYRTVGVMKQTERAVSAKSSSRPVAARPAKSSAKTAKKSAKKSAAKSSSTKSAAKSAAKPSRSQASTLYRVHPGVAMIIKWRTELQAKSGRTLEGWCAHLREALGKSGGIERRDEFVQHLKMKHGMGSNTAWWIAERALGELNPWDSTPAGYLARCPQLVDDQFPLAKAHLRPICDALLDLARALAPDVGISPCETIIPVYRNFVIAQISVPNRKAVHFGLALKGEKFTTRLIDTGGTAKKNRITHRFHIESLEEIDDAVRAALLRAYELDA